VSSNHFQYNTNNYQKDQKIAFTALPSLSIFENNLKRYLNIPSYSFLSDDSGFPVLPPRRYIYSVFEKIKIKSNLTKNAFELSLFNTFQQ